MGHPVLIILTIPLQTKAATRRSTAVAPAPAEAASATTETAPAATTIPGTKLNVIVWIHLTTNIREIITG